MPLSTKLLVAEADRLIARTQRQLEHYRRVNDAGDGARRAASELKRLRLYRAVLAGVNSAHALMPEYVVARSLAPEGGEEP